MGSQTYFTSPSYIPKLPFPPPDSTPVHEVLFGNDNSYGRYPISSSKPPFTCGISEKSYSVTEVASRIEALARALAARLSWCVNEGDELSKVVSIFSLNSIDTCTVAWATHRVNGVANNLSASFTAFELAHQLRSVNAKALFTCIPLIDIALQSAAEVGIPRDRVFLLDVPVGTSEGAAVAPELTTVDDLIREGNTLLPIEKLQWTKGQGSRQTAFLSCSSGTSGLPKIVKISHCNVLAMLLQAYTFESVYKSVEPDMSLGVLPISHNYGLIVVSHFSIYRGDGVVLLPDFDLNTTLRVIEEYRIQRLWMVPAMIGAMLKATALVKNYDISCIKTVVVGASNLTKEVATQFVDLVQGCTLIQGYGLTETTVAVTFENPLDIMFGSCGHLFSGCDARLIDPDGKDVMDYDHPGELLIRGPTNMMGYHNNKIATEEMLIGEGWLKTGDLAMFKKSPNGHDHLFLLDRVKELIKVRGLQVSPTELESFLLSNPKIADVAIVPVPDEAAGELPMAFIVKSAAAESQDENALKDEFRSLISETFSKHKHLAGGIEFVKHLPKSPTGKTKRKIVKEWAATAAAAAAAAVEAARRLEKPIVTVEVFDFD
ncbi:hypothetical protein GGI43DRAFT_333142 [Trichoderma evansii]